MRADGTPVRSRHSGRSRPLGLSVRPATGHDEDLSLELLAVGDVDDPGAGAEVDLRGIARREVQAHRGVDSSARDGTFAAITDWLHWGGR